MGCGISTPTDIRAADVIEVGNDNDAVELDESFVKRRKEFWETRIEGNVHVWQTLKG